MRFTGKTSSRKAPSSTHVDKCLRPCQAKSDKTVKWPLCTVFQRDFWANADSEAGISTFTTSTQKSLSKLSSSSLSTCVQTPSGSLWLN